MASIEFRNVTKSFHNTTVIKDLNLTIKDGSFTVLVGPSGCGKTTLLRMIAGIGPQTSGAVLIDGTDVTEIAPGKRGVAMVFQNYAIYPTMSVEDNIEFGLKNNKVPKEERKRLIAEAAEKVGLTSYLTRMPSALSGGQRQRVALARAMVKNPSVFLMDEPLSNLDAKLRVQMRVELIELHNKLKTTFVYVTHDQVEAMTLGDRIVIMKDGFIQQIGTPQEVFDHPANLFVAGFIGTPQMNYFDAKLVKDGAKYSVETGGMKVELSEAKQKALAAKNVPAQDITLGVRPSHMVLTDGDNAITATVDVSEMMGSEVHLHANANGKDVVIIVPTVDLSGNHKDTFSYGAKIKFTFNGNVCHVFGSDGKNLEF